MRLRGATQVTAVDLGPYAAALPLLLTRWRELTFVDGVVRHPVTGVAHEGLQVVAGHHPYPGVAYRLMVREEDVPAPTSEEALVAQRLGAADPQAVDDWERGRVAAARASGRVDVTWHTLAITVGTDDARRTTFAVHDAETDTRVRVDLTEPARPGPVDVAAEITDFGATSAFLSGTVEILLRLEVGPGVPHLVLTVRHRRGRAHADVGFTEAGGGRWQVTADVDAHGAGWLRPLVAVVAPFLRKPARSGLDEVLAGLPPVFDRMAAYRAPADPHVLADQVLADLISEIPVSLPPAR